jgi:type III restriction enzyme
MREHAWETPTTYEPVITKSFKALPAQPFGKDRSLPVRDYREAAPSLSETRKYLFKGFKKCGWDTQRFHSDGERRFAVLIDDREPSVKVWIKPAGGVFNIAYARGHNYEPDFLVETITEMLISEVKARNEMNDPEVVAKALAAREWVNAANKVAADTGRKPWRYALIPDDAITHNATLEGLYATYG